MAQSHDCRSTRLILRTPIKNCGDHAMKQILVLSAILFSALLAAVGFARAAQPPDVVKSDANFNTAMGDSALLNLTTGYGNTASGDGALSSDTTGFENTASGLYALSSNTTGAFN